MPHAVHAALSTGTPTGPTDDRSGECETPDRAMQSSDMPALVAEIGVGDQGRHLIPPPPPRILVLLDGHADQTTSDPVVVLLRTNEVPSIESSVGITLSIGNPVSPPTPFKVRMP